MPEIELTVSQFVATLNQTLEYAYPNVTVIGELANLRVSKNRWIYFDLRDEEATVRCFGSIYVLPGPLEDGMLVKVIAQPHLHEKYGFSLNIDQIVPSGEGAIKKAANLLETKLAKEGLFDPARKRTLPYPPTTIGLITSTEAAAFTDFIKIMEARFGGLEITVIDVHVQGELAADQIVKAIEKFNQKSEPPEALVITRGGGSAEDLQAFNTEVVIRAVATSRIPTLVAIGHERDISLAELAADQRASTPSNAAELLVPDKTQLLKNLKLIHEQIYRTVSQTVGAAQTLASSQKQDLKDLVIQAFENANSKLLSRSQLLELLNPQTALTRGYAILRKGGKAVKNISDLRPRDLVTINMLGGEAQATVNQVQRMKG